MAYDGEEAMDLVAKQQPDIILLDIMMPKMKTTLELLISHKRFISSF